MGSAHIYDLGCSPQSLKNAARWVRRHSRGAGDNLLLARHGAHLFVKAKGQEGNGDFDSGHEVGSGAEEIAITRAALRAAAKWAETGRSFGDVYLLVDDRMLLVYQGDDRAAFDTDGSPASEEYLAVAPLDR